jgi:hypothetical protein
MTDEDLPGNLRRLGFQRAVGLPVDRLLEVFFSGSTGSRIAGGDRSAAARSAVLDAAEPAEITLRQAKDGAD